MSRVREERIVLAAAALIAMGRDDRTSIDEKAAKCAEQADALLSALDATEPEEDSDADAGVSKFEEGYELGVSDTEVKQGRIAESLQKEHDAKLSTEIENLKKGYAQELKSATEKAFNDGRASAQPAKK
jgi:hypothetical protein